MTPVAAQVAETWLPSLVTDTPQEGFDLAVSMARRAVKTTQPEVKTLMELRPRVLPGCGQPDLGLRRRRLVVRDDRGGERLVAGVTPA